MEWAEGGSAEGLEGVKGGEECVWVLQNQAAGRDAERGAETLVGVGDLDCAGAGEGLAGFEGEGELPVGGEVILVGEVDGGGFGLGLVDALAEQSDGRTRRGDGDGQGEGAAVFERDLGGEVLAGVELRRVEVRRKREEKVFSVAGPPSAFAGVGVKVRLLRTSFWTWSRREPASWAVASPAW